MDSSPRILISLLPKPQRLYGIHDSIRLDLNLQICSQRFSAHSWKFSGQLFLYNSSKMPDIKVQKHPGNVSG